MAALAGALPELAWMSHKPSELALPHGRCSGPALRLLHEQAEIYCWRCGRPLEPDEDFGQWRLRVVRRGDRTIYEFRTICPLHYR